MEGSRVELYDLKERIQITNVVSETRIISCGLLSHEPRKDPPFGMNSANKASTSSTGEGGGSLAE